MRTTRLLSTITATLLLSAGAAAAGDVNGPVKPERAPAAQRNAPADKIAPNMHAGQRGPVGTTGQGSAKELRPGASGNTQLNEHGTVGASPQKEELGSEAGPKAEDNGRDRQKSQTESNDKTLHNESGGHEHAGETTHGSSRSSARENSGHGKSETTGQGAAASASKLTTKQRTRITTVFKKEKVEPAHVNFSVRVGVHVPEHVHYYPVPTEVVRIYPEWRGYDYILVSSQILIIDPHTRVVVAILEV